MNCVVTPGKAASKQLQMTIRCATRRAMSPLARSSDRSALRRRRVRWPMSSGHFLALSGCWAENLMIHKSKMNFLGEFTIQYLIYNYFKVPVKLFFLYLNCLSQLFLSILSGVISKNIQRHGSVDPDPDPPQNVMDPQHCFMDTVPFGTVPYLLLEFLLSVSVLRIRDVYFGSQIRIFSIPDPGFASKSFSILTPKKRFPSSLKYDPGYSSRIQILIFYPSRIRCQIGTGFRIPDLGSASLIGTYIITTWQIVNFYSPDLIWSRAGPGLFPGSVSTGTGTGTWIALAGSKRSFRSWAEIPYLTTILYWYFVPLLLVFNSN